MNTEKLMAAVQKASEIRLPVFVVKYYESERGWGSSTWYTGFKSPEEAKSAVLKTNERNTESRAPDYYITATYMGEMDEVPKDDE